MPSGLGCADPDCHRCRAASEGLEIGALWRPRNGKDTFMGIAQLPCYDVDADPIFLKLNDPKGDLEGPGHEMSHLELLTECMHYDNYGGDLEFQFLPSFRCMCIHPARIPFHVSGGIGVKSFEEKPQDFTDSQDDEFDVKFPDSIRAGDSVKIVACGLCQQDHGELMPFMERFWVDVISVTSFGTITGVSRNNLHYCNVSRESGLLSFDVSAVLGVKHGENWDNHEEGDSVEQGE